MNFFLETLRLGLANLLLHKLRSFLTALGIIIGVAAVIGVVAIGEGNKRQALADIEKLGANNIIVRSRKPEEPSQTSAERQFILSYGITFQDERMSTMAVTKVLIEADRSRKRRKDLVDKMAASYILQGALDWMKNH